MSGLRFFHFGLLAAALAGALRASGAEVRVVATAAEKTGEWASAYTDINAAVAAAGANGVVLFKNGTYGLTSSITLTADNQTLRGETRMGVVLDGQSTVRILDCGTKKSPVVEHLTFKNGRAASGAAIYRGQNYTETVVTDCDFFDNVATGGSGGAIYSYQNTAGRYTGCRFFNNRIDASDTSSACGGALCHDNANYRAYESARTYVTDCVFSNNWSKAKYSEGGAFKVSGFVTVKNTTFVDNRVVKVSGTPFGGTFRYGGDAVVDGCTITGLNSGNGYGSFTAAAGKLTVTNCVFTALTCPGTGMILSQGGTDILVTNSKFVGITNSAEIVMMMYANAKVTIRNCVFAENAGGVLLRNFAMTKTIPRFENCTVVNNAGSFTLVAMSSCDYAYTNVFVNTIVQGSTVNPTLFNSGYYNCTTKNCIFGTLSSAATNNVGLILTQDPICRSAARGDYVPREGSVAVDAALPLDWMEGSVDLNGNPRVAGAAPDIGACERQEDETDPDYSSRAVASEADRVGVWANAHIGIQNAIDAALDDDTVYVKEGLYLLDAPITLQNRALDLRGAGIGKTIVDGQGAVRCLLVKMDSSASSSAYVSGFTFQNGAGGEYTSANYYGAGGGVYLENTSSPLRANLTDCRITASHSPYRPSRDGNCSGGGAYVKYYCTLTRCLIDNNSISNSFGAGLYVSGTGSGTRGSGPVFTDCIVSNNTAWGSNGSGGAMGAGAYLQNGCWWEGCDFANNGTANTKANYYGGAIQIGASYQVITNCSFHGNIASYGICAGWKVTHCRHWNNSATGQINAANPIENCWFGDPKGGSVLFCQGSSFSTLRNCIFEKCKSGTPFWLFSSGNVTGTVENCTFVGNTTTIFSQKSAASGYKIWARNCIFWDNTKIMGVETATSEPAITFENCLVSAYPTCSYEATDSLVGVNPLFENADAGNYQIKTKSPARDAAKIQDWMKTGVDYVDSPRIMNKYGKTYEKDPTALPDIGAYECTNRVTGLKILWK